MHATRVPGRDGTVRRLMGGVVVQRRNVTKRMSDMNRRLATLVGVRHNMT